MITLNKINVLFCRKSTGSDITVNTILDDIWHREINGKIINKYHFWPLTDDFNSSCTDLYTFSSCKYDYLTDALSKYMDLFVNALRTIPSEWEFMAYAQLQRSSVHRCSLHVYPNLSLARNFNTHFYIKYNAIEWRRSKQTVDWGGKLQLTSSCLSRSVHFECFSSDDTTFPLIRIFFKFKSQNLSTKHKNSPIFQNFNRT